MVSFPKPKWPTLIYPYPKECNSFQGNRSTVGNESKQLSTAPNTSCCHCYISLHSQKLQRFYSTSLYTCFNACHKVTTNTSNLCIKQIWNTLVRNRSHSSLPAVLYSLFYYIDMSVLVTVKYATRRFHMKLHIFQILTIEGIADVIPLFFLQNKDTFGDHFHLVF